MEPFILGRWTFQTADVRPQVFHTNGQFDAGGRLFESLTMSCFAGREVVAF